MLLLLNKIYFAKLQHWLGRGDLCNARKKTFFSREMFPRWLNEEVASLPSRSYWGSSEVCAPHRPLVHLLLLAQSWSFLCINMKIKHRCKSLEQTYQQKSKRKTFDECEMDTKILNSLFSPIYIRICGSKSDHGQGLGLVLTLEHVDCTILS